MAQTKAITFEEWERRGSGYEPPEEPPEELGESLSERLRRAARYLIHREQTAMEEAAPLAPRQYIENKYKAQKLSRQFRAVAEPGWGGLKEAMKVICRYRFGLLTTQPS